jgi:hypothetical protein
LENLEWICVALRVVIAAALALVAAAVSIIGLSSYDKDKG